MVLCFFGLQVSYLTWGFLQERVIITIYHAGWSFEAKNNSLLEFEQNSTAASEIFRFKDSQFIVFGNRLSAFILSAAVAGSLKYFAPNSKQSELFKAPYYTFVFCALSNILSAWCQYESLKYVDFPTQRLSKAFKMLPVILIGRFFLKQKYTFLDYLIIVFVTIGSCFFFYEYAKQSDNAQQIVPNYNLADGLTILAVFLLFDSFTSNWEMMAMANFFAILLTFTSLLEGGKFFESAGQVFSSGPLFRDCLLMSFASAGGQSFIFLTVQKFGPLVLVMIMNIRQILSILISALINEHFISPLAFVGIAIIFGSLIGQAAYNVYRKFRRAEKAESRA